MQKVRRQGLKPLRFLARGPRMDMEDLKALYRKRRKEIARRLADFSSFRGKPLADLLPELCFCLLTPGTSAERADRAMKELQDSGLLLSGTEQQLARRLKRHVRFHNQKARSLVRARGLAGLRMGREWLVENVRGLGWKEATHFLRNTGHGRGLAILDRHILKNLKEYGAIRSIPKSLSKKRYLSLEKKLKRFSRRTGIPAEEMDLLLWSKETGRVFK